MSTRDRRPNRCRHARSPAPTPRRRRAVAGPLVHPPVVKKRIRSRRASLALRWWARSSSFLVVATDLHRGDRPTILSSPAVTWHTFWNLLLHQDLLGDIGISLARAAIGLAIGGGLGLVLGVTVGLFALGEELLDSSLQMFRTIPFPAVLFLFIFWSGTGEASKVILIALATLFPMYINAVQWVRNVDRRVVEAARSFGVRGHGLVRLVVLPMALPSILTGLRFATGVSIIALVFAETINANQGIGALVEQAVSLIQVPVVVVCILVYAAGGHRGRPPGSDPREATDAVAPTAGGPVTGHGVLPAAAIVRERDQDLRSSVGSSTISTSRSEGGSSWRCSARRAAARPRCCACCWASELPDEGEILAPAPRTTVFQEPRLVPSKRVWRNVVLGLPRATAHPAASRDRTGRGGHDRSRHRLARESLGR